MVLMAHPPSDVNMVTHGAICIEATWYLCQVTDQ